MADKLLPFTYCGGKITQLNWLVPIIHGTEHITYVEPFGGSASVILNKDASKVDVYNDIFSEIVTFFKVLRNNQDELIEKIRLTPFSREEYQKSLIQDNDDEIEIARKFFVKASQVMLGNASTATSGRWKFSKQHSCRNMSNVISSYLSYIENLEDIANKFKKIQIEYLDCIDCIKKYDCETTLFYLDPPYTKNSRKGGKVYKYEFSNDRYISMMGVLQNIKGKFILSGYNDIIFNKYNFYKYFRPAKSIGSTRKNIHRVPRQEIIFTNYKLNEQLEKFFVESG